MVKEFDLDVVSSFVGSEATMKEQCEFFYLRLRELTDALFEQFRTEEESVRSMDWNLYLGKQAAQIHHNSHTWCLCDPVALLKQINESKKPSYLGTWCSHWKTWQDNSLQPNIAIIEGKSLGGTVHRARMTIIGLNEIEPG
jgi:hypothetical protein